MKKNKKQKTVNEEIETSVEVSAEVSEEISTEVSTEVSADTEALEASDMVSEEADVTETDNTTSDEADNNKSEKPPKTKGEASPIRLIVTLAAICVAIAVLLSGVNLITRDKIAKAAEKEKSAAILTVFSEGDSSKLIQTTDAGDEIHLVYKDNKILGYCIFTTASGFGGDIKMIVGIDAEYKTHGVKIISMSETPGIGTKTNTISFLSQFIGASHDAPTADVTAISGATISSNAVKSGVEAAHKIAFDLQAAADAEGTVIFVPSETDGSESESTEPESTPSDSESITEEPTTDSGTSSETEEVSTPQSTDTGEPTEETSDIPYSEYRPGSNKTYQVDVDTSFDRYVIEVTKETDEEGSIVTRPPEPTESATPAPDTEPVSSETTGIVSIPVVTTAPETSHSPMGSATVPTSEPENEPQSSEVVADPVPTTPVDTTPVETTPISPDTSDPNGEKEPVVRPGISIGGRTVGQ